MRKLLNYTAELPQELRQADQMLTAYGRWAKDRQKVHRCGSAEGRFRPPPDETVDDDARREPRETLMPTPDALQVHRALIRVEEVEREILQILYVPQRMRIEQQLRLRRIPGRLCQERHLRGLRMFANLIKTHA
jgi:hypothetical protein